MSAGEIFGWTPTIIIDLISLWIFPCNFYRKERQKVIVAEYNVLNMIADTSYKEKL